MTQMILRSRAAGAAIAATLAGLAFSACGGEGTPEPITLEPVQVAVTPAWSAAAERSFTARVEATRSAQVATRTSGTVTSILADVGDRVAEGQVLARLDDVDVRARISAAEAQVELAAQTQGRIARLAADGAASQQELDEASARLAAARAGLAEATAQAAYVEVVAPFAGVVTSRTAHVGDLALPGQPMMAIEAPGALKVVADLPADEAGTVTAGTEVVMHRDGTVVTGRVTRVVPALDPRSRRFRVEVTPGASLPWPSGEIVTLGFTGEGAGSRWIPADAVVRRGQLEGVFTVESDSLRLRWLRLGRTVGDAVEVLAGPAGELRVVRRPAASLVDGAPVAGMSVEAAGAGEGAGAATDAEVSR